MSRQSLSTLGVAVCCVLAIGAAATAMESAVETSPDEAIDVGYDALPLDGDTADRLKRQMQPDGSEQAGGKAPADPGPQAPTHPPAPDDSSPSADSGDAPPRTGEGDRSGARPSDGPLGPGTGSTEGVPDLLARLLDALLSALVLLVPVAAIGLAARYRARLAGFVRSFVGALVPARLGPSESTAAPERPPPLTPENDVAAAWYAMVSRLGLSDRPEMTPGQCVDVATEAGVDPEPVERLTGLFERVRYGNEQVTDRKRDRSRRALGRVLDQVAEGGG